MTPTVPEIRAALEEVRLFAEMLYSARCPSPERAIERIVGEIDRKIALLPRIPADAVFVTPESLARALRRPIGTPSYFTDMEQARRAAAAVLAAIAAGGDQ